MRRAATFWCLAAAMLVAVPHRSGDARAADPLPVSPAELVRRVNVAIDRGVAWLRTVQRKDGLFPDNSIYPGAVTSLVYHTLRMCRVPAADPAAETAFRAVLRAYQATRPGVRAGRPRLSTYGAALFCMAISEHGTLQPGTDVNGERTYVLEGQDAACMKELVKYLEDTQDSRGRWSYCFGGVPDTRAFDNSNTQYALLGLKAASRAGVRAKTSTWMKSLQHFLNTQEEQGETVPRADSGEAGKDGKGADTARGWSYDQAITPRDSMTAGGVGSVVICRSELLGDPAYKRATDAKAETAVRDGLAWLGRELDRSHVFDVAFARTYGWDPWRSYTVYGIERAGVLAGVERMGRHDWYAEGAEFLTTLQDDRGAWGADLPGLKVKGVARRTEGPDAVVSTCFALLFLSRGTIPVGRGSLTRAPDDSDINFDVATSLADRDFEDFLDLVLSRWRRASDDEVKQRLFAKATAVGPRIVAPLVQRLSSLKDEERAAAFLLLARATGLDHGFDPAAAPELRDEATVRWQAWWLANEKALTFDAASGRLVAK